MPPKTKPALNSTAGVQCDTSLSAIHNVRENHFNETTARKFSTFVTPRTLTLSRNDDKPLPVPTIEAIKLLKPSTSIPANNNRQTVASNIDRQ